MSPHTGQSCDSRTALCPNICLRLLLSMYRYFCEGRDDVMIWLSRWRGDSGRTTPCPSPTILQQLRLVAMAMARHPTVSISNMQTSKCRA